MKKHRAGAAIIKLNTVKPIFQAAALIGFAKTRFLIPARFLFEISSIVVHGIYVQWCICLGFENPFCFSSLSIYHQCCEVDFR